MKLALLLASGALCVTAPHVGHPDAVGGLGSGEASSPSSPALMMRAALFEWTIVGNWDLQETAEGLVEHYLPVGRGEHSVLVWVRKEKRPKRFIVGAGEVFVSKHLLIIDQEETGNVEFVTGLAPLPGSPSLLPGVWSNVQNVDTWGGDCGWEKIKSNATTGVWSRDCKSGTGDCTATLHHKDGTTTSYSDACGATLSGNSMNCTVFCE